MQQYMAVNIYSIYIAQLASVCSDCIQLQQLSSQLARQQYSVPNNIASNMHFEIHACRHACIAQSGTLHFLQTYLASYVASQLAIFDANSFSYILKQYKTHFIDHICASSSEQLRIYRLQLQLDTVYNISQLSNLKLLINLLQ